jgi:uroporphyrinogen decarboxylase
MMSADLRPRELVRRILDGFATPHLPIGELLVDDELVRELVGLDAGAALPMPAKKALLQRWQHDVVTVALSHGWGAPSQPDLREGLARVRYWAQNSDLFIFALLDGPFSLATRAWSWEQALVQFSNIDAELEGFLADAVIDMGDLFKTLADAGANGIIIGDDIAYRRGPYVNPEKLRRTYFPFLTLMIAMAQDMGLAVVFHSDGNLWPIWNDILRAGVDGVQCLDPYSAMSLALARQRSPENLCLWGNLDLGWLLSMPNQEQLRNQVQTLLDPIAGSPAIFGTSSGLHAGLPLPLLDQLYAVARAYVWPPASVATK